MRSKNSGATPAAYHAQGLCYQQLGDFPQALTAFKCALKLAPERKVTQVLLEITQNIIDKKQNPGTAIIPFADDEIYIEVSDLRVGEVPRIGLER